jgi:hypothetical protein
MVARMTPHQQIFAVALALLLVIFVVDQVRRRRLKEEYSWLWLLASLAVLVLMAWPAALVGLAGAIGATTETTAVFTFGLGFLALVCLHLCTKLSQLDRQVQEMAQELALLNAQAPEEAEGYVQT